MAKHILSASERDAIFREGAVAAQPEYSPTAVNPIPDDPHRPRSENDELQWTPDWQEPLPFEQDSTPHGNYVPIPVHRGLQINLADRAAGPLRDLLRGSNGIDTDSNLGNQFSNTDDRWNIPGTYESKQLGPMILDHLKRNQCGLGSHWSTRPEFAEHMAVGGDDEDLYDSSMLSVVLDGEWNHQGEDPKRSDVGWISDETAANESEITLLPHAPVTVKGIRIRHPRTKTWHNVLDKPVEHYARLAKQRTSSRRQAVPADPSAQWGADAERMLTHQQYPGITVKENPGDQPTHGIMVSLPHQEKTNPSLPSSQQVRDYVHEHHDLINSDPENYYGGWEGTQDGHPRWFNDVSHHYTDPWEAAQAAVSGNQLGVYDYDDPRGEINTPEFFNDQIAKGGARHGSQRTGHGSPASPPVLPDLRVRDPLQAVAGQVPVRAQSDSAHTRHESGASGALDQQWWTRTADRRALFEGQAPLTRAPRGGIVRAADRVAVFFDAATFDPKVMVPAGSAGGNHGAQTYRNPTTQEEWVVKQPGPKASYLAHLDVAANHIAAQSGIDAPETYLTDLGNGLASAQVKFPGSTPAFPHGFQPDKLSEDDLLTIQKHHALDWLLSNHDSHPGGFIRLQDGRLAGIDKGQAQRYRANDRLHWGFHPNSMYNEKEPVANTLWRNFAQGGKPILDPSQGELAKYIQGLQNIPDEEYQATWTPYAQAAAKAKALALDNSAGYKGFTKPQFPPNDVAAFLKAIIERKHNLAKDFQDLYAKALAHRMTGTHLASQQVSPAAPYSNSADRGGAYSQDLRECLIAQAALSDPYDVGFGEFGPEALAPFGREASVEGFKRVVGLSPRVEVGGLAADLPIAPVQDEGLFFRGRIAGVEDAVGDDMGSSLHYAHPELSVPVVAGGGPVPAPFSGRITGHVPPEGFLFGEVEGTIGSLPQRVAASEPLIVHAAPAQAVVTPPAIGNGTGTISHIDSLPVGHAPGLFPQARERSLREFYAAQESLDLDLPEPQPSPLYRGMVLDLTHPDAATVRRSLLGNGFEDYHSPDAGRYAPCNGCPHPGSPPIPAPGPGDGVQGSLPLSRDFSDAALGTNGKGRWRTMGQDILDLTEPSDDIEWSTDPQTAEKSALEGDHHALRLPVVLSRNSPVDDIHSVRILHPQSGHWFNILPPATRTASYYQVHLDLHDGTPSESLDADIFHDARQKADALAQKHGLEIREKAKSPDDYGRGNTWLPAYRDGQWVGNIAIEKPESLAESPMGPHANQYAYAARTADLSESDLAQPSDAPELDIASGVAKLMWNGSPMTGQEDDSFQGTGPLATGSRIAYAPDPATMQRIIDHKQDLGSHGSQLWQDSQGRWLLKKPNKGNEFLVPLELATSQLQQHLGLEAPEVHAVPIKNGLVTAHKMYPGAKQAWQKAPHLHEVSPQDLLTLQKHHALDWLLSNHDAHVGNFLRTQDGGLVGIDKGQALKHLGSDRLDWDTHYNYYARPPVYNNLWKEFAEGHPGEMNDPREGELGDFVTKIQSYPDQKLRALFHPYASAAQRAGKLATGVYGGAQTVDPLRGLSTPRIPSNDVQAFLDALVQRKAHLSDDLGEMYDRAATHRATAALNAEGDDPSWAPPPQARRQPEMSGW